MQSQIDVAPSVISALDMAVVSASGAVFVQSIKINANTETAMLSDLRLKFCGAIKLLGTPITF